LPLFCGHNTTVLGLIWQVLLVRSQYNVPLHRLPSSLLAQSASL
jgi:hypothetical protein